MSLRHLKAGYLLVAWLDIYATAYYFNYLFFRMREDFGFGNQENLFLAALNGLIYVPASWWAGKLAQRHGYFWALRWGFGTMAVAMAVGHESASLNAQVAVMIVWTLGLCLTWPALEALMSENETRGDLAQRVGLYNVVWASGAAAAYFSGGALLERLGRQSLYWLPAALYFLQFGLVLWLEKKAGAWEIARAAQLLADPIAPLSPRPESARTFLRMAWLANPFAYVAMNTVIPTIPDLAARMGLSTSAAGFVASVWMFLRLAAFVVLWHWTAWHYRFSWLAGSYLAMIATFAALLLIPKLWVIVVAQIVFGLAVGLIYYSSLFYSMDVGETKGEHGGVHEAAIGVGLFLGPAVGATALRFFPASANVGIWTVSGLLALGLAGLFCLRGRR